ncbi:hypothetical protein PHSY_000382 [Pseudozyma hubeiensis SY62]|uniref:Inositol-pentakisphosphate 2-kinase n=1 Tax=Pseudozyma hubeiensis (strain SY62) TaxID=1305764 RepID=R9NWG9_PSEHS|nr:hypothetical protein PHSY_000382 [Pseudozyma hubeiensis SY62]GAC92826.1 hypothetical protein PHSY_000382 [Pseudozyma hubeiensis SY62]
MQDSRRFRVQPTSSFFQNHSSYQTASSQARMPPTPFQPSHQTPFKSTVSTSQQSRIHHTPFEGASTDSQAPISVSDIDPSEWKYHAEGGKNLLLSFDPAGGIRDGQGPFATSECTYALRIRKSLPADAGSNQDEEEEAEQFTQHVVQPLLGSSYVLPRCIKIPILTARDRDIIETLSARIEMQRPAARRAHPARIRSETLSCIYAVEDVTAPVLADPSAQQEVLCVEIKPKWGFLARVDSIPPSSPNLEIKARYSRYRMHRVTKHAVSDSAEHMSLQDFERLYDPLDLYSTDATRKRKAVGALWRDWIETGGKTNNLRLFWNGAVVGPQDTKSLDSIARFLGADKAVAGDLVDVLAKHIVDELSKASLPSRGESEAPVSILSRLAHLQSALDPLDVEGLAQLWLSRTQSHILGQVPPDVDLPPALTRNLPATELLAVLEPFLSVSDRQVTLEDAVQAFLVAATFKDCSMLLRFHRSNEGVIGETKLVDLDSKPFSKLSGMQKTDNEVCAAFLAWLSSCEGSPAASMAP